jgi:hypothetical protein
MWVFPNGQAALVYSWGANTAPMSPTGIGITHGVGGVAGFQVSFSNAKTISELKSRSVDAGGGTGYGVGASVDASLANDGSTFQRNYTVGAGFGGWGGGIVFQNNKVVPACSN